MEPVYHNVTGDETRNRVLAAQRRVTPLAMTHRFTQAELIAIEIAQLDDPTAVMASRQNAAGLRVLWRQMTAAQYIDLDDLSVQAALTNLETAGLLATGRAAQIYGAEVEGIERP